jgi:hypothetical protein
MDRFWNRLEKDKPASSSQAAPGSTEFGFEIEPPPFNIHHFPKVPGELERNPRYDLSIPRLLPLHSSEPRYLPRENIFVEIWPHSVSILHPLAFKGQLGICIRSYNIQSGEPPAVAEGQLYEKEISDWLSQKGQLILPCLILC